MSRTSPVRCGCFAVAFDSRWDTRNCSVTEPPLSGIEATSGRCGGDPRRPEAVELAFWQSVEASDDPKEYQAYLEKYPEGAFKPLGEDASCRLLILPDRRSHGGD